MPNSLFNTLVAINLNEYKLDDILLLTGVGSVPELAIVVNPLLFISCICLFAAIKTVLSIT